MRRPGTSARGKPRLTKGASASLSFRGKELPLLPLALLSIALIAASSIPVGLLAATGNFVYAPPQEEGTPAGVAGVLVARIPYHVEIKKNMIYLDPGLSAYKGIENAVRLTVTHAGLKELTISIVNVEQLKEHFDYLVLAFSVGDAAGGLPPAGAQIMALTLDQPSDTALMWVEAGGDVWHFHRIIYFDAKEDVVANAVPIVIKVLVESL